MRFDREQHGAAGDFQDPCGGDDCASDRSWREMAHLTSLPTVTQPAGKCGAAAAAEAISIARIIIGVPKTNGMPSR